MIAIVLAAGLAACSASDVQHERWTMKTRPLLTGAPADALPLTFPDWLKLPIPKKQKGQKGHTFPDAPIDDVERGIYTANVYACLAKISADDCDLHVEVSGTPACTRRAIVEVPASGHQAAAVTALGLVSVGTSPHRFKRPVPIRVTGLGFYDLSHRCAKNPRAGCHHGSAAVRTLLELHPALVETR